MIACAAWLGRETSDCTRGLGCICEKEKEMKKDIIDRLNGPGISDYELDVGVSNDAIKEIKSNRAWREQYETSQLLLNAERIKSSRYADLLRQIGYPKRGTDEEKMDIFDAARLIQSNFSVEDLE